MHRHLPLTTDLANGWEEWGGQTWARRPNGRNVVYNVVYMSTAESLQSSESYIAQRSQIKINFILHIKHATASNVTTYN